MYPGCYDYAQLALVNCRSCEMRSRQHYCNQLGLVALQFGQQGRTVSSSMSERIAGRHDHDMTTAAENEPLFSAEDGDDVVQGESTASRNASRQNGHHYSMTDTRAQDSMTVSHYPPPKYLKSTYTSREHEFDASDDFIEPEVEDQTRDLPVMTGLLQTARSRGSVEVHRRGSASSSNGGLSPEDAALENGLIVGMGSAGGGGIMASVS